MQSHGHSGNGGNDCKCTLTGEHIDITIYDEGEKATIVQIVKNLAYLA